MLLIYRFCRVSATDILPDERLRNGVSTRIDVSAHVMSALPSNIFDDPSLYWVEYRGERAMFAQMTRHTYHQSIFTDRQRILASVPKPVIVDLDELISTQEKTGARPVDLKLIVHTANCGSTLLSRALDIPGRTIGYREPFPLRQLGVEDAASCDGSGRPAEWGPRLNLALTLLGRKFSESEIPVVKANIPVNFILTDVLDLLPNYRVIILYSTLENFLISALKSPDRRKWLRAVANEMSSRLQFMFDTAGEVQKSMTDCKLAAALWAGQIHAYQRLIRCYSNVAVLESSQLFEQTEDALRRAAGFFEIDFSRADASRIAKSDLFQRYSKNPGRVYDDEARKSEQARVRRDMQSDISEGQSWGDALMDRFKITPQLSNTLLSE